MGQHESYILERSPLKITTTLGISRPRRLQMRERSMHLGMACNTPLGIQYQVKADTRCFDHAKNKQQSSVLHLEHRSSVGLDGSRIHQDLDRSCTHGRFRLTWRHCSSCLGVLYSSSRTADSAWRLARLFLGCFPTQMFDG